MDDKAREARNAYHREWARRNRDKVRLYQERHWAKAAIEQANKPVDELAQEVAKKVIEEFAQEVAKIVSEELKKAFEKQEN